MFLTSCDTAEGWFIGVCMCGCSHHHPSLNSCGENVEVRDPERVRHKGCGSRQSSGAGRVKRIQRCTKCRNEGHNSRKCPFGAEDLDDGDLNYTSADGDDDANNSTYTDLQSVCWMNFK